MKKIGILLAILLIAGVCAMADEAVSVQDNLLFADIDAVALSSVEMDAVDGGMGIKEFSFKASIKGVEIRVVRDAELAKIDYENRETRKREIAEKRERRQKMID